MRSAICSRSRKRIWSAAATPSTVIALYRALGGGWTSTQPLIDPATRDQMQQRTDWGDLLE